MFEKLFLHIGLFISVLGLGDQPTTYWMLVAGATGYVAVYGQHENRFKRLLNVIISILLGLGGGATMAEKTGYDEGFCAALIIIFGVFVLDLARAIVTNVDLPQQLMAYFFKKDRK